MRRFRKPSLTEIERANAMFAPLRLSRPRFHETENREQTELQPSLPLDGNPEMSADTDPVVTDRP